MSIWPVLVYKQLPFAAAPVGDMFQCIRDEIFSDVPNVFGIMDDILVIGYDKHGTDHDAVVHKVLQWCKEVNLKLKKKSVILCAHLSRSLGR